MVSLPILFCHLLCAHDSRVHGVSWGLLHVTMVTLPLGHVTSIWQKGLRETNVKTLETLLICPLPDLVTVSGNLFSTAGAGCGSNSWVLHLGRACKTGLLTVLSEYSLQLCINGSWSTRHSAVKISPTATENSPAIAASLQSRWESTSP